MKQKKIIFPDVKSRIKYIGTLFEGAFGVLLYSSAFVVEAEFMLFFRFIGIPVFLFALNLIANALISMFEYMVLEPESISFYGIFVPIAKLKIETIPHIGIVWDEYSLRYGELVLSDYSVDDDKISKQSGMTIYIKHPGEPSSLIYRVLTQNKNVKVIVHYYCQKYDYAIREYYGIGANMWKI